jgi:hypothetical protein
VDILPGRLNVALKARVRGLERQARRHHQVVEKGPEAANRREGSNLALLRRPLCSVGRTLARNRNVVVEAPLRAEPVRKLEKKAHRCASTRAVGGNPHLVFERQRRSAVQCACLHCGKRTRVVKAASCRAKSTQTPLCKSVAELKDAATDPVAGAQRFRKCSAHAKRGHRGGVGPLSSENGGIVKRERGWDQSSRCPADARDEEDGEKTLLHRPASACGDLHQGCRQVGLVWRCRCAVAVCLRALFFFLFECLVPGRACARVSETDGHRQAI